MRLVHRSVRRGPATRSIVTAAVLVAALSGTASCAVGEAEVRPVGAGSTLRGLALFIAYAIGMGLVVAVAALGVALVHGSVVARLRGAGALVPRLSGLVLLLAGGYVAWYGWYEVRLAEGRHDAFGDPVVVAAARIQQRLVAALDGIGPAVLAVALVALLLVAALVGRRRPGNPTPAEPVTVSDPA
ncbi:hypothetical protein JNW88_04585 [Micromonospora sp. ATA32]|nr:hypothetical protein [Micromonospora sp. ATA32]